MTEKTVVVLDYGSDDTPAIVRALELAGASVEVTFARPAVMAADGMIVSGTGDVSSTMRMLLAVRGPELIERRLAGGRGVLGIGTGMHILFERDHEGIEALGEWPGALAPLAFTGSGAVETAEGSLLFAGLDDGRFTFDHAAAATDWTLDVIPPFTRASLSWADEGGRFLAAVENGPLAATQFHPQSSGDAGIRLLRNWLTTL